jgi:hypothetical protein
VEGTGKVQGRYREGTGKVQGEEGVEHLPVADQVADRGQRAHLVDLRGEVLLHLWKVQGRYREGTGKVQGRYCVGRYCSTIASM